MHVTLFMKFTLQFWLLRYLAAVHVRKFVTPLQTEKDVKTTALIVDIQSAFSFLDRHAACLKKPHSNKGTHTLCRLRCAL